MPSSNSDLVSLCLSLRGVKWGQARGLDAGPMVGWTAIFLSVFNTDSRPCRLIHADMGLLVGLIYFLFKKLFL